MLEWSIAFYGVQFGLASLLKWGQIQTQSVKQQDQMNPTTIIIPFKNESDRLLPILHSFNQAAIAYKNSDVFKHLDIIFIDDHSTDSSWNVILDNLDVSYRLLKQHSALHGKKSAIHTGVKQAKYSRILTLDADVSFEIDYLYHLLHCPVNDLCILPVKMTGNALYTIEFEFLQSLTFGSAGLKYPTLCNGANLLYSQTAYWKAFHIRSDFNTASGDDIYLLESIKKLNGHITAFKSKQLTVKTPAPNNRTALLKQRLRWIKKGISKSNSLGGTLLMLSNIELIFCLIQSFQHIWFLLPIGIKVLSEWMLLQNKKRVFILLVHQLYYPIYLIMLGFEWLKFKPTSWK